MKRNFSRALVIACMGIFASFGFVAVQAQTTTSLESIRSQVAKALGVQEMSVEISATPAVVTILRINSQLNAQTHPDRNAEATFIAGIVAKAIKGNSQFSGTLSISIDFIDRSGTPLHDTLIDHIDFREDPKGDFVFHAS